MLDVIRRNSQSWVVKVIFAAIILTFVFWGANSMTSDSAEVLAQVNGESIYRNDLMQELRVEIQNIQFTNPGMGQLDDEQVNMLAYQILSRMVSRTLMEQEAKNLGISVSDAELSAIVTAMPDFRDTTGRFSHDIYKDRLVNMGLKVAKFEEMVTSDILLNKLQSYITSSINVEPAEARRIFDFELQKRSVEYVTFPAADYLSKVNPEEAAVISYYSENKDSYTVPAKAKLEYLIFHMDVLADQSSISDEDISKYYEDRKTAFVQPAQYQVRHILVALPLTLDTAEGAVLDARKKADSVLAELKSGKKFAALAKQYSDDSNTKDKGGDLGWVVRGQLSPSLDLALEELKPGQVSEPIRTANGFHILELMAEKPESQQALAEVREDILAQLREDAFYANTGKVISAVEDKIISKESFASIAQEYSVTPQSTELAEIPKLAAAMGLAPDALAAVSSVPAGEMLSSPIDLGRGFMVVKVDAYKPSYVPDLDAVRAEIVVLLKEQGAIQLAAAAAEEVLKEAQADDGKLTRTAARKGKISQPVTRYLGLVDIGFSQEMTSALFTAQKGEWINRVFLVGDNAVMARITEVSGPSESEWTELAAEYTDGLNSVRKSEVFNIYLAQLQKDAKIDIKTERLLGGR